jgi:hypothetical protein
MHEKRIVIVPPYLIEARVPATNLCACSCHPKLASTWIGEIALPRNTTGQTLWIWAVRSGDDPGIEALAPDHTPSMSILSL